MKTRWIGKLLGAAALLLAGAQAQAQVTVTVSGGVGTVSPSAYQMQPGQDSITIALGARGYRITGVSFNSGSRLFRCTVAGDGSSARCAVGQRQPGAQAEFSVQLQSSAGPVGTDPGIFIQSE